MLSWSTPSRSAVRKTIVLPLAALLHLAAAHPCNATTLPGETADVASRGASIAGEGTRLVLPAQVAMPGRADHPATPPAAATVLPVALPSVASPSVAPANDEIVVIAKLDKPKKLARRDFEPVAHLRKVRREAMRVGVLALAVSGIDGIVTARCVAAATCIELNPLFGRTPSLMRLLGVKAVVGGTQLHGSMKTADRDPFAARSNSYVSLVTNSLITAVTMGGI